ncbi:Hypothetical predicted protein [Mytilus galloprovincialis]|uniref:Uncharacterized protein n=1 Tax=Mytilus galloprovincialis TaxID=29158 RepID=A0A8B6D0J4_MYTGA|nr:Hypothetical predicted protein [Mytilus galloprovincialis]
MAACANCNKAFSKKKGDKGYFRFSLENSLTGDQSARDLLTDVTGATFTPVSSKRLGQFVCPECWTRLNDTAKYQNSLNEFWGRTFSDYYISQKKRHSTGSNKTSPIKKARFTSTPCRQGFESAATTCKTIIEKQHQQQNVSRINVTNKDADLFVAIAVVVPNIEDEVNNLSASSQDTIIMNMDDTIPYGMDDTNDDDVLDDSLSDHSNSDGIHLSSDDEDDISDGEEQAVLPHESDEEKEENPQIDLHPGFSMCWDNVGKKVTSRHPSETSKISI